MVMPLYERIIALARTHARHLVEHERIDERKIRVVNNGIDTVRFHPVTEGERSRIRTTLGIPLESFVAAIVAALRPEKNHEMFLAAASRMAALRKDSVFLVVGDGAEAEKLHRIAGALSLGGVVRFLGRRDDVAEILAAADASVLCSHPVVETFPISVLEAMACGVPVVSTDVGAVREMFVDGSEGFIIPPGDGEALAAALAALAIDPAARRGIGERARERAVREFTVERMVRAYAELFDEMCAAGGGVTDVIAH